MNNMPWNENIIICKHCGKHVAILNKNIWAYKEYVGNHKYIYFCSWKCLRAEEVKQKEGTDDMARKLTLEQKKKAVQIATDGGDPVEFLRGCGCDAPDKTWWYIKNKLKDSNPELYAQIPDRRKQNAKNFTKVTIKADSGTVTAAPDEGDEEQNPVIGDSLQEEREIKESKGEPPIIKILVAECGRYTFENRNGGILIRDVEKGELLMVDKENIEGLVKVLPFVKNLFWE